MEMVRDRIAAAHLIVLLTGVMSPRFVCAQPDPSGVPTPRVTPTETPTLDPAKIVPQPTARPISDRERLTACRKYEGRYISYFGDVFKVQNCARRHILSHISITALARQRVKIIAVDSAPIAAIPEGEPLSDAVHNVVKRNCRELTGRYVTFSFNDIYFVENCKKRLFPDWATYLNHRARFGAKQREILGLTWPEFDALQAGLDFPSSMDQEFEKSRDKDKPIEMIPIMEACKGVENRFVSFHSKMYFIEKCRKREVDPEKFTQKRSNAGTRIIELRSEQWQSLPNGKPY